MPTSEHLLLDHQRPHFGRIVSALHRYRVASDNSPPGTGKTYCACAAAGRFDMDLLAVAPCSVCTTWKTTTEYMGSHVAGILSYGRLQYAAHHNSEDALVVFDGKEYVPTLRLMRMRNVLLVLDEAHALKNNSQRRSICRVLSQTILRTGRVLLLTGTPGDKPEHPIYIYEMCGIIMATERFEAFRQVVGYCFTLDADATVRIVGDILEQVENPSLDDSRLVCHWDSGGYVLRMTSSARIRTLLFELYHKVFKQYVASSMPLVDSRELHLYNYRLKLNKQLKREIDIIMSEYKETGREFSLTTPQRKLERRVKLGGIVRLARYKLRSDPNRKVIIYLNFLDSIEEAAQQLRKYCPLVMTGGSTKTQRDSVVESFQMPTNKYRVLISNAEVGGIGISLDDTDGRFPRTIIMNASFRFISAVQAARRVARAKTQSDSEVFFVYAGLDYNDTAKSIDNRILETFNDKLRCTNYSRAEGSDDIISSNILPISEGVDLPTDDPRLDSDEDDRQVNVYSVPIDRERITKIISGLKRS